jgi:peptide/nickel transport system permease protein
MSSLAVAGQQVGGLSVSRRPSWLASLAHNTTGLAGFILITLVILTALTAPWIAPHNPDESDITLRLQPPAWVAKGTSTYLLGTDQQGRDILSRAMYGGRISLLIGFTAVAISGTLGATLGLLAGYFGRAVETLIMRIADIQLSLPFILLAIAVMAVIGPGLWKVIVVLGLTGWETYARLVRAESLVLREQDFVVAARALGASHFSIIRRHLLPNVAPTLIVWATVRVGGVIVLEATLTFLGLGVEATVPTWGRMLADGRSYISNQWWLTTFPGLAIMLTVLGINLFGDWVRDWLDPRLKTIGEGRSH